MRNRGFTLIELLIVIGLLAAISGFGANAYFGIRNRKVLEAQANVVAAKLVSTRERSKAQEGGDGWGIRFENPVGDNNDYYEIWTGDSYATGTIVSTINLSPGVVFIDPASGSNEDIIFLQSTGIPMNGVGYTIVVQSVSSGDTITIIVNPLGVILVDAGDGAYDVSTAAFVQIALSVGLQESGPRDMLFNNDGTKLYITGDNGDEINEYSLTTAYDISSATSPKIALNVSAQEAGPASMLFNNDGTKLYLIGWDTENVYEYSLNPAYDISTATFIPPVALDVQPQEETPLDMIFNNDGTKLYVIGWSGLVNEYSLTTAYDIRTATFAQIALNVSEEEAEPSGILFNNDGTKLYVVGRIGDDINEYSLTTAYDISTATFTQIVLDVSAQDIYPVDMIFNNDGTKFYVMGRTGDNIYEYAIGG